MLCVSVACKPCSDEEVLLAVCTSDFGKYVLTNPGTAFMLPCLGINAAIWSPKIIPTMQLGAPWTHIYQQTVCL